MIRCYCCGEPLFVDREGIGWVCDDCAAAFVARMQEKKS